MTEKLEVVKNLLLKEEGNELTLKGRNCSGEIVDGTYVIVERGLKNVLTKDILSLEDVVKSVLADSVKVKDLYAENLYIVGLTSQIKNLVGGDIDKVHYILSELLDDINFESNLLLKIKRMEKDYEREQRY